MLLGVPSMGAQELAIYKVPFGANIRYQWAQIPAGGRGVIYTFTNWGDNFRAFIDQVGIGPDDLPWDDIHFLWMIDLGPIDDFQYQIAPINEPKHFEPPFVARRIIEWIGVNNDVVPHVFEVLCDGVLAMKPTRRY